MERSNIIELTPLATRCTDKKVWREFECVQKYTKNVRNNIGSCTEDNSLVSLIRMFLESQDGDWTGKSSELFNVLKELSQKSGIRLAYVAIDLAD